MFNKERLWHLLALFSWEPGLTPFYTPFRTAYLMLPSLWASLHRAAQQRWGRTIPFSKVQLYMVWGSRTFPIWIVGAQKSQCSLWGNIEVTLRKVQEPGESVEVGALGSFSLHPTQQQPSRSVCSNGTHFGWSVLDRITRTPIFWGSWWRIKADFLLGRISVWREKVRSI